MQFEYCCIRLDKNQGLKQIRKIHYYQKIKWVKYFQTKMNKNGYDNQNESSLCIYGISSKTLKIYTLICTAIKYLI